MTKKNWALSIILIILIGVFGIMISQKSPVGSQDLQKSLFAVADTANLERLVLKPLNGKAAVALERKNGQWVLNDKHPADPAMVRLLLSVLHDVKVKRKVAQSQQQEVGQLLEQQGVMVEMDFAANQSGEKQQLRNFVAGGSEANRISYFGAEDAYYVVEIPGYASYISGLFALRESDLRQKTITSLNSMNFQALEVQYPADTAQNLSILYRNNMLGVQEVSRPDSSVLFQYMMIYEPLQIAGYLSAGEDAAFDSLLQTAPLAIFNMKTVGNSEGLRLHLYPALPGKNLRLGYLPKQKEAVLLDERLAQAMLIQRRDLLLKR